MPPHCDTMDGPVVTVARQALEQDNVKLVLPYVPPEAEAEVTAAFRRAVRARRDGAAAREVADLYFFETVVRLHRAGEGAPYTGIKPAGLDEGPVIPVAEQAIESGSPDELIGLLGETLQHELRHRFEHLMALRDHAPDDVPRAREYVEAMLGLEVFAHHLYQAMHTDPHEGHGGHQHG